MLEERGRSWRDLSRNQTLFSELALLDHSYHSFTAADSVFDMLDNAGALKHRVGDRIEPGSEIEPFVPETRTRAKARARFIAEHAPNPEMLVNWDMVHEASSHRYCMLSDPFATEFEPWQDHAMRSRRPRGRPRPAPPPTDDVELDAEIPF